MPHAMVLVERDVLQHELETVFDMRTTETLLRVLDRVVSQVYGYCAANGFQSCGTDS